MSVEETASGVEEAASFDATAEHLTRPAGFWRRYGWLFAVVALVVLGRLWGLADYLLDWDECNELAIAKLPVLELIRVIYSRDIHPPAAHLVTHFWLALVGDSDFKIRILYAVYGLLGLWGTYFLARLLNAPKRIAVYTLLLGIFCPFVWHYTHLATHHAFFYATAVFSWVFFLRLLQRETVSWRSPDSWGYALVTLLCLYAQSITPFLLLSQAVYLFWQAPQRFRARPWFWLSLALIFVLCYLPQLWAISQPWHPSKMKEMGDMIHGTPSWGALLFMPAQLFWMGDDKAFQPFIPTPERLLFYGGLGTFLFWYGVQALRRVLPGAVPACLCITAIPVLLLFLVSVTMGLHVLHGRAILYATFPILLTMACWFWEIGKKRGLTWALPLLIGCMAAQAWVDYKFYRLPTSHHRVETIRQLRQAGDGFLVSPGFEGLWLMRYLDPAHFGLTANERHMNPRRENLFHMVQQIDETYFFVSGQDVREKPEIRQAFQKFQEAHERIWYLGDLRDYNAQLDCQPTYIVWGEDNRYWQFHCSFLSPRHCRAPLTGPDADRWQCNSSMTPGQ